MARTHTGRTVASLLTLLLTLPLAQPAGAAAAADDAVTLPITKAVLFSSGVGYFEHHGVVRGDQTVRLTFKTDQINDILKSMVVIDLDGGTVQGVNYAANDPLDRTLRSFGVDLSKNPTLPQLLDQLRGTAIIVQAPNQVTGRILNVETRTRIMGSPPVTVQEHILNIVTDSGIRAMPMSGLDSIQLADTSLQEELDRALLTLVSSRDTEQKAVEVQFAGRGERRVKIGYLIETPVWKTSYRLDLAQDEPLLQGWAIVENTGNTDWSDVRLSLVSGRPISFVQDLYTPLYMPRPVVVPELFASLRPQTYDQGMKDVDEETVARHRVEMLHERGATAPAAPPSPMSATADQVAEQASDAAGIGVQALASGEAIGELFQFTLAHPVDMPRRQSAMLPIVNEHVDAERVSIYNADVLARHPLNGVHLQNTTDLKLLAGPVTVFDGGSYAGDAQIGHLSPGEKRLLSYAVDLDVTVDSTTSSNQSITSARIVRGVMHVERLHSFSREYKLASSATRDRVLMIEHPKSHAAKLVEPAKFEEETDTHYRFRTEVAAGDSRTFRVVEQRTVSESIAIIDRPRSVLQSYLTTGSIDPKVREALDEAIAMRSELHQLEAQRQQLQQELVQIQNGQKRLRENLQTVGSESELGRRYLARLNDDEDRVEEIEQQVRALNEAINQQRERLEQFLLNLNVRP